MHISTRDHIYTDAGATRQITTAEFSDSQDRGWQAVCIWGDRYRAESAYVSFYRVRAFDGSRADEPDYGDEIICYRDSSVDEIERRVRLACESFAAE